MLVMKAGPSGDVWEGGPVAEAERSAVRLLSWIYSLQTRISFKTPCLMPACRPLRKRDEGPLRDPHAGSRSTPASDQLG